MDSRSGAGVGKLPSLADVRVAAERIAGLATRSPLVASDRLSALLHRPVWLKLETVQPSGSFKIRGAANAVLAARERGPVPGVVAASTGNHGIAVAQVAGRLGIPVRVYLPNGTAADRVEELRRLRAEVALAGPSQTEAVAAAQAAAREHGHLYVPPFDHPDVVCGAGTVGLELCEQVEDVATVVLPVSGGGLAAGVGLAVDALRPDARVVAVGAERAPAMRRALDAGRPVPGPEWPTVADSLSGAVEPDNAYTFPLVREHVDECPLVSERQLVAAMGQAVAHERLVLEGAAAAPLAWLETAPDGLGDGPVVVVVTGSRVSAEVLAALHRALLEALGPVEAAR